MSRTGCMRSAATVVVHRLVEAGEERLDCIDALAVIVGILIKSD